MGSLELGGLGRLMLCARTNVNGLFEIPIAAPAATIFSVAFKSRISYTL